MQPPCPPQPPKPLSIEAFSLPDGLRPVILLGAGRSGTKFLRNLIDASPHCTTIANGINATWRHGNETYPDDALPLHTYTLRKAHYIRKSLAHLAEQEHLESALYLVEKTSANALRVAFVHRILPDARFIHILRDGRDVVASAYRRWTAPPDIGYLVKKARAVRLSSLRFGLRYLGNILHGKAKHQTGVAIWGPRYPGIETDLKKLSILEVCAKQWVACVETALHDLASIPEAKKLYLRYEDLVTDSCTVEKICTFLDLPDPDIVFEYYHATVRQDSLKKWQQDLREDQCTMVLPILEPLLTKLDYTL